MYFNQVCQSFKACKTNVFPKEILRKTTTYANKYQIMDTFTTSFSTAVITFIAHKYATNSQCPRQFKFAKIQEFLLKYV